MKLKILVGVVAMVAIVSVASFYLLSYAPKQAQQQTRQIALEKACQKAFESLYTANNISGEGFVEACRQEASHAVIGFEGEVDVCLNQTNNAEDVVSFITCTAAQGLRFSGEWVNAAE